MNLGPHWFWSWARIGLSPGMRKNAAGRAKMDPDAQKCPHMRKNASCASWGAPCALMGPLGAQKGPKTPPWGQGGAPLDLGPMGPMWALWANLTLGKPDI